MMPLPRKILPWKLTTQDVERQLGYSNSVILMVRDSAQSIGHIENYYETMYLQSYHET